MSCAHQFRQRGAGATLFLQAVQSYLRISGCGALTKTGALLDPAATKGADSGRSRPTYACDDPWELDEEDFSASNLVNSLSTLEVSKFVPEEAAPATYGLKDPPPSAAATNWELDPEAEVECSAELSDLIDSELEAEFWNCDPCPAETKPEFP